MSAAKTMADGDPLQEILGPHAGDLDDAAATEDDPAVADACAILAAVARGETPPEAPARRSLRRAKEALDDPGHFICAHKNCTSVETTLVPGVNGANDIPSCDYHHDCDKRGCSKTDVTAIPIAGSDGVLFQCGEHIVCDAECGNTTTALYEHAYGTDVLCAHHAEDHHLIDDGDVVRQ